VSAFVVAMAKVFEDFVTTALRGALAPYPGHTDGQYRTHLDTQQTIAIRPDVVHVINGQPVVVFDAKYKLEDSTSGYPNADAYQMLAYCTALGLQTGWLVYALGSSPSGGRRVHNTSIDIVHFALDLTAPPTQLLGQVEALGHEAFRIGSQTRLTNANQLSG
jgi:5-methylcytosine-specific restriction enzyme subunit McrC